jgi:hypothetical protein
METWLGTLRVEPRMTRCDHADVGAATKVDREKDQIIAQTSR